MSRIVTAIPKGLKAKAAAANDGTTATKQYFERVGQYVPAEIIMAFTALNGALATLPDKIKFWAFLVSFLICWIFTPIYFKLIATTKDRPSLRKQQVVSFFAFLFWAYATSGERGVFGKDGFDIYYAGIGSALIILFSIISGAIIPRK